MPVSIVAALKVLSDAMPKAGLRWNQNVLAMLVVEEETGGNGSLSLAIDRDLKQLYDSIVVCECTGLKFHPANRGAVWYRADLRAPEGVSALEMFAFINEEMEKEGGAIRAESRHPLFPQRPVQTCHGIIGPYGEHPSRICGEVSFTVRFERPPAEQTELLLRDFLEAGLAGYVGLYGDKTKVTDQATGKPMVARHYDFQRKGDAFRLDVHGAAGHMGAIRERDGAITKMAHLVRSLVASKPKLEASARGQVRFELAAQPQPGAQSRITHHPLHPRPRRWPGFRPHAQHRGGYAPAAPCRPTRGGELPAPNWTARARRGRCCRGLREAA
jgi:acetylornithine deacetylase/succinyl-diaminopimelate desuccinylase-like protein